VSLYVVVEGHGEEQAMPSLVGRLRHTLQLGALPHIPRAGGVWRSQLHLHTSRGKDAIGDLFNLCRARGPSAVLVTQDSEDSCPRDAAPQVAAWVRPLGLPFPVAVVLFYREYETMFLAASGTLQGSRLRGVVERAGLPPGSVYLGDPEAPRDAKGWMTEKLGRPYLPNIDQDAFTRTLDLADPRLVALSSFRRLCSALSFLADHAGSGQVGMVYP
jgi:hypothetical protein